MINSSLVRTFSPALFPFEAYTGLYAKGYFYVQYKSDDRDLAEAVYDAHVLSPYITSVIDTKGRGTLFSGIICVSFRLGCLDGRVAVSIGKTAMGTLSLAVRVRNAEAHLFEGQVSISKALKGYAAELASELRLGPEGQRELKCLLDGVEE